ncbi:hypothetical protein [Streptacidiphilus cavernicola]|uniref:Cytoplasmic protein n=1 Tax=Streptacidiphilus cavernicola TaxID=3342716 RepID=A0ABV6VYE5_9ACTN
MNQTATVTAHRLHTSRTDPVVLVDLDKDADSCHGCYAETAHLDARLESGAWQQDEDGANWCAGCVDEGVHRPGYRDEQYPRLSSTWR